MWNNLQGHDYVKLIDEKNVSSLSKQGYGKALSKTIKDQVFPFRPKNE